MSRMSPVVSAPSVTTDRRAHIVTNITIIIIIIPTAAAAAAAAAIILIPYIAFIPNIVLTVSTALIAMVVVIVAAATAAAAVVTVLLYSRDVSPITILDILCLLILPLRPTHAVTVHSSVSTPLTLTLRNCDADTAFRSNIC